jgi:hypothetical protein
LHSRSLVIILALGLALTTGCLAEDAAPASLAAPTETPAPAAPASVPAMAPPAASSPAAPCIPDTDVFRRTPTIDGKIEDGEWDVFYVYSAADVSAVTYVDWDSRNLYMAAKSDRPFDFMAVLDANADGWFHGDENYEFKAVRGADGTPALKVARYESRNTKAPVATPVSESEAAMVEMRSGSEGGAYVVELRMPAALVRGFRLRDGQKIGFNMLLKAAADESAWAPTNQIGDVKECTLVTKKFATLKPLEVGFDLKDTVVARGETLAGKFHLTNTGAEQIDVRSFTIGGEGKAGGYLSSQRIRLEGLAPKQHVAHGISTLIPSDMPVGCWAIGAEVRSSSDKMGAGLVSFEVVDPFDVELKIPLGDVRSDVKDVSLAVNVKNNMRRRMSGRAKITLPTGWELWRNLDTRDFGVSEDGGVTGVVFKAKPPLGELGDVPVKIEVTMGKDTKTVEGRLRVVNP